MKKIIAVILILTLLPAFYVYADIDYAYTIIREVENFGYSFSFEENGKWGMKNSEGNIIIDAVWDELGSTDGLFNPFTGDSEDEFELISVRKGNLWGMVDNNGNIVLEPAYKEINMQPHIVGREEIRVMNTDDKYGFINRTGNIIIPCIYDYADMTFQDELCVAGRDFGYTVIDKKGNELMPLTQDKPIQYRDRFTYIVEDGSYMTDKSGNIIIKGNYDQIYPLNSWFKVIQNQKQGIVDINGNIILPFIYNSVFTLANTIAATTDNMLYYYDENLNLICESELLNSYCDGNILYYRKNGLMGLISSSGKILAPAIYEDIYCHGDYFNVKLNGKWGILNSDGSYLAEPEWSLKDPWDIEYLGNNFFSIKKDDFQYGILNKDGKLIIEPVFKSINVMNDKIYVNIEDKNYEIQINENAAPVDDSMLKSSVSDKEIEYLTESGILKGDDKGEYNLYSLITRAEFLTLLSRVRKAEIKAQPSVFSDTQNHWAENIISEAYSKGIIKGYGDGTLKPDEYITMEELLVILFRAMGLNDEEIQPTRRNNIFSYANYAGLLKGISSYNKNETVLRKKSALIIYNYLHTDKTIDDIRSYNPSSQIYVGN